MKWDWGKSAITVAFVTAWAAVPAAYFSGYLDARDRTGAEVASLEPEIAEVSGARDDAVEDLKAAQSEQRALRGYNMELLDRIAAAAKPQVETQAAAPVLEVAAAPRPAAPQPDAPHSAIVESKPATPNEEHGKDVAPEQTAPVEEGVEIAEAAATPGVTEPVTAADVEEAPSSPPISKAAYASLRIEMDYQTTVAILGRPQDSTFRYRNVNGTHTDTHFWNWTDEDGNGASLTLRFIADALKSIDCTAAWAQAPNDTPGDSTEPADGNETD